MTRQMKQLMLGLTIFLAIVAGILVVYKVRQPKTAMAPSPAAQSTPAPAGTPTIPEVFVVGDAKCALSFSVAEELVPGLNCIDKLLYKNVASNTAGTYSLTAANKLANNFELKPGDTYIYVINYKNTGTGATGGTLEDVLPAGITYKDSTDGCTYAEASRKVTCTIASVAADGTGKHAIRFTVNAAIDKDSLTNTAIVKPTTGDQSTCKLSSPIETPPPSGNPSPSPSPSVPGSANPSPSPSPVAQLDCVAKRVYADNSSNTAGQYYLNSEITDTNTLQNGQTIVYNVLFRNTGNAAVPSVTVTDVLSSNLTYLDGESGCTYDSGSRMVTCTVGSLAANTETSRSFRVRISTAGAAAIANTADVFSTNGQRDTCSITVNATGQIVQPPSPTPTALPEAGVFEVTAGTLGIGLLLLLVGAIGLLLI